MTTQTLQFTINGVNREVETETGRTLLDLLRDQLKLTGTKQGCDNRSECGTCTVIIDGSAVKSCVTPAVSAANRSIETIEGLGGGNGLHPLQEAFVEKGAVQCGFCTPGMIMELEALLRSNPTPSLDDIKGRFASHICRCTGYVKIFDAAEYGARLRRGEAREQREASPSLIGRSIPSLDSKDKATGRLKYAADLYMEGMLYGKILQSPHPHAVIRNIDTSDAEKVPGVTAVFTARSIKELWPLDEPLLPPFNHEPILADDRVRYVGEPVAGVAASSMEAAQEALAKIKVDYEILEPVFDIEETIQEGAPKLHPDGNEKMAQKIVWGDVDKGFAQADVTVEHTYSTPIQEHIYLEREAALAYIDEEGVLVLQTATQYPYATQKSLVQLLGVDSDKVRVITPPMGGSFGGKHVDPYAIVCALLCSRVKKPVKFVLTREESMLGTTKRHSALVKLRTGATRDGKLVAASCDMWMNCGGYFSGGMVPKYGAVCIPGPYDCPNVFVDAKEVITNGPKSGSFRGLGAIQVAWACEQNMDMIAEQLGMDPWEIRKRNVHHLGSMTNTGQLLDEGVGMDEGLEAVHPYYLQAIETAQKENDRRGPEDSWRRGVGLACGWRAFGGQAPAPFEATVELLDDGTLEVRSGLAELGTGAVTGVVQIGAEVMGIPPEHVTMIGGDSTEAPFPFTTSGEKAITLIGGAVLDAAIEVKQNLLGLASDMLEERPEGLALGEGFAFVASEPSRRVPQTTLIAAAKAAGISLKAKGSRRWPKFTMLDPDTGRGVFCDLYSYMAELAEVDVNRQSGDVRVLRIVHATDVGTVINPLNLEGQIHGSIFQGLGYALTEDYRPGQTRSYRDYQLPTVWDVPEIVFLPVGEPVLSQPFGAKGGGETGIAMPPASILNAISNAVGIRIFQLPATPARVKQALQEKG